VAISTHGYRRRPCGSTPSASGGALTDDSASIISSMGLSAEEREKFWADFHDLERRAAETDRRIEEHKEDIALLIERLQRLRKRLERYC
jgi:hypothetical protein